MKQPRNSKCTCGSGIKFKRCCGHEGKLANEQREARERRHQEFLKQLADEESKRDVTQPRPTRHTGRQLHAGVMMAAVLAMTGMRR